MFNNEKKLETKEVFYHNYKINISPQINSLTITIYNQNISNYYYQASFKLQDLHKIKLLISRRSINEIIDFILILIEQKNIKIEENEINLKFILISTIINHPNVGFILNKKNIIINNKDYYLSFIKDNNNLKKDLNSDLEKINEMTEKMVKNNIILKKEIEDNKMLINKIENSISNLEKKIQIFKEKNEVKKYFLKKVKEFKLKNIYISSMSILPSGKIISISNDKSIKIIDLNFNIIQTIEKAHVDLITNSDVKDEDNFVTCSNDQSIKTWIKKENKYQINKIIKKAHLNSIRKIIYYNNENLISCSLDKSIKIWKENKDNYINILTLNHLDLIFSILSLKDKNILISSGIDGTKFWCLKKYICLFQNKETVCKYQNALCRLNKDNIIVQGNEKKGNFLKIISIEKKDIINNIKIPFQCSVIHYIINKEIIIIGGKKDEIIVYRNYTFELIQIIFSAHIESILGIVELKNGNIISFSKDNSIKIWETKINE